MYAFKTHSVSPSFCLPDSLSLFITTGLSCTTLSLQTQGLHLLLCYGNSNREYYSKVFGWQRLYDMVLFTHNTSHDTSKLLFCSCLPSIFLFFTLQHWTMLMYCRLFLVLTWTCMLLALYSQFRICLAFIVDNAHANMLIPLCQLSLYVSFLPYEV